MTFRFFQPRSLKRTAGVRGGARLIPAKANRPQNDYDATRSDYYVLVKDQEEPRGPFTKDQLRTMWNRGQVDGRTLFARFGMSSWLPLILLLPECDRAQPPVAESFRRAER